MNPEITAQEVFDTVVTHLRTQNAKCVNEAGRCSYKNDQGLKCAVGCLIVEEDYDPKIENKLSYDLITDSIQWKGKEAFRQYSEHQNLLRSLQVIHDDRAINRWEEKFKELAGQYKLIFTPKELQ